MTTMPPSGAAPARPLLDMLGRQRELPLLCSRKKSTSRPLVDGDQAGLILGPAGNVLPPKGQKLLQHGIVALVAFILAAVVVALSRYALLSWNTAPFRRAASVRPCFLGNGLELLNEGRLTVTGVTADDNQAELALKQRELELLIQIGRHVDEAANFVEATGTRVGHLTLAIEGSARWVTKGLVLGLGRFGSPAWEPPWVRHQSSPVVSYRAQALDLGHGGQEFIDRREAILRSGAIIFISTLTSDEPRSAQPLNCFQGSGLRS